MVAHYEGEAQRVGIAGVVEELVHLVAGVALVEPVPDSDALDAAQSLGDDVEQVDEMPLSENCSRLSASGRMISAALFGFSGGNLLSSTVTSRSSAVAIFSKAVASRSKLTVSSSPIITPFYSTKCSFRLRMNHGHSRKSADTHCEPCSR